LGPESVGLEVSSNYDLSYVEDVHLAVVIAEPHIDYSSVVNALNVSTQRTP
jgi:hypothetical protein